MKTKKILLGTLVAGVLMFFLGYLVYGIVLAPFMTANCSNANARPMEEMVWWALILANFLSGLLLAICISWKGVFTAGSGASIGVILGTLIALSFDLNTYSMTTTYHNFSVIIADVAGYAFMFSASGLLTALVMKKIN